MMNCLDCNKPTTAQSSIKFALPDVVLCVSCWIVRHPENKHKAMPKPAPVAAIRMPVYVSKPRHKHVDLSAVIPKKKPAQVPRYDNETPTTPAVFSFERKKEGHTREQEIGPDILDFVLGSVVDNQRDDFLPALTKERVLYRDGYKCIVCRGQSRLSVHHIKPRSEGGGNQDANLVTLCTACHDEVEVAGYKNVAQIIGHAPTWLR